MDPQKGKFACPKCGRRFVAPTDPEPVCRRCRVLAVTVCRRCDHSRPWASSGLQYCKACVDFVKFHRGGGISETPTGRLSDRRSRARRVGGESERPDASALSEAPILPPAPKRSRTSRFAQSMRRRPTPAEDRLGRILNEALPKKGQVQAQWQFGCGKKNFILDFYIREVRLGIEVDGPQHGSADGRRADKAKEDCLAERGVFLVRITNTRVMQLSDSDLLDWLRGAWHQAARFRDQA